jgi:hypothetical protein
MAIGYGLFIWSIRHFGEDVTPWELIPALIVAGLGMGCVVAPIYAFILAEVPVKDAGSASGVINTVQQVGGAIGVAVVGVVFFGLIGSQAATSVASVRDQLTADLSDIGVPKSQLPRVTTSFETCFVDRANAKDLSAVPESCQRAQDALAKNESADPQSVQAIREALEARGLEANRRNFISAIEWTLVFQIVALAVIFFLTFLLPARPRSKEEMEKLAAEGGIVGI